MLEYISENKEWLFSGIGVTILIIIGGWLYKSPKQPTEPTNNFGFVTPPTPSIISLYSFIPSFILKFRFTEIRVNSLIEFNVRSSDESIRLNLGELPDCQVWLQVINHSPFDLEIENIKGDLNHNGCRISIETMEHINIAKHSSSNAALLEGTLTGEQANHCSKENKSSHTSLRLRSRIRTRFGVFKKHSGDMQYVNVYIINKREIKN